MILVTGIILVLGSLAAALYVVFAPPVSAVPLERRRAQGAVQESAMTALTQSVVDLVDRRMRSRNWAPFTARELELAAVSMTPGYLVVLLSIISIIAFTVFVGLTQNVLIALIAALVVPFGAKIVIRSMTSKRRQAFAGQLDETLQLLAAALRAGHGLTRAFDTVSKECEPPMSSELSRIVNENRIGRDLVEAVSQTADRMQSADFQWVAEAVGIQRETGGNLNEVLGRVGDTIRERGELAREVRTLSAEGRMSAMVLAALPFLTVGVLSVVNPAFMNPLYTTRAGLIAFGISSVLFVSGILWMKIVVNVKV